VPQRQDRCPRWTIDMESQTQRDSTLVTNTYNMSRMKHPCPRPFNLGLMPPQEPLDFLDRRKVGILDTRSAFVSR
jgi:hypothetical protein